MKKIDKIFINHKKNVKSKNKNMFYQIIKNKIMLKNIKRGKNYSFVNINIYNSKKFIFSNNISNLPKILKTLKIKKKLKNRLKPKKIIKKKQKIGHLYLQKPK